MLKIISFAAALGLAAGSAFASEGHMHGDMHGDMHAGPAFGQPAAPGAAGRTIAISLGDMSFSPAAITVKAGETVRFQLTNASAIDHDFTLGDAATQAAHRKEMARMADHGGGHAHGDTPNAVTVKAGETKVLLWRFAGPGTVEFDCNVPGHYESGMTGIITVTP